MAIKWKKFKLTEVLSVSDNKIGKFLGKKDYIATGDIDTNKIVSSSEVTYENRPSRATLLLKDGDVLFAKMKNTVKVLVGSKDTHEKIFSTGFYILTPKENVSKELLYFFFLSEDFNRQKDLFCTGATMSGLNNTGLRKIEIPIPVDKKGNPDIYEQERIVAILKEIESLREKRVEIDKKMDMVIPALFSQSFQRMKNYKNFGIEKLISSEENSLKTGPFGSSLKKETYTKSGYRVYGQEQVIGGSLAIGNYFISEQKYTELKSYAIKPGDILISLVGTYGKILIVPDKFQPGIINPRLIKITLNYEIIRPRFFAYLLQTDFVKKQFERLQRGQVMGVLNLHLIKSLKFIVPPISEQDIFLKVASDIEDQKKKQNDSTQYINTFFQSLISQAYLGKL